MGGTNQYHRAISQVQYGACDATRSLQIVLRLLRELGMLRLLRLSTPMD